MAEKIPMLALSPTMEQGTIVKWVKQEGEHVEAQEVLCEVETDKATMEYESPQEGTLLKIIVQEGAQAAIGEAIAIMGKEGEDVSALLEKKADQPPKSQPEAEHPADVGHGKEDDRENEAPRQEKDSELEAAARGTPAEVSAREPYEKEQLKASPIARRLATEHGIDISTITGSGPHGRIIERDLREAIDDKGEDKPTQKPRQYVAQKLEEKEIPLTQKRKVIAKRLSESMFTAPHYYLTTSVNMDEILHTRELLKSQGQKVSLNAFLLKFTAEALKRHQMVNSSWAADKIVLHASADIALAVAQPDGLVAPVIRGCHNRTISDIDAELREVVDKARQGKLPANAYANATFTITNLGTYDVEEFTAIINPPASAILAVGKIMPTPVVNDEDELEIHNIMKLTLGCDHRVIDGAAGAQFLRTLKLLLQSPAMAML